MFNNRTSVENRETALNKPYIIQQGEGDIIISEAERVPKNMLNVAISARSINMVESVLNRPSNQEKGKSEVERGANKNRYFEQTENDNMYVESPLTAEQENIRKDIEPYVVDVIFNSPCDDKSYYSSPSTSNNEVSGLHSSKHVYGNSTSAKSTTLGCQERDLYNTRKKKTLIVSHEFDNFSSEEEEEMFQESESEFSPTDSSSSSEEETIQKKSAAKKTVTEFKPDFDKRELAKKSLFEIPQGSGCDTKSGIDQGNIQCESSGNLQEKQRENIQEGVMSKDDQPLKITKSRKRVRNEKTWGRNIVKTKRLMGQEYKSRSGKIVPEKELKPHCSCRNRCYDKLSEEERNNIFNRFWKINWDQRKQFVAMSVVKENITRERPRNGSQADRRQFSYKYFLTINSSKKVKVCKIMFLNTYSITEKFVQNCVKNTQLNESGGCLTSPDKRHNHPPTNKIGEEKIRVVKDHIESFPVCESHYRRDNTNRNYLECSLNIKIMYNLYKEKCIETGITPVKESYYRHIFNTQYNISFKTPQTDTCDDCDAFEKRLKDAQDELEKEIITEERNVHHNEAKLRYDIKREDKERSRQTNSHETMLTVDLQKCLPTPSLTNCKSFYLRKLWTLNFTILNSTKNNEATCLVWDETVGARGGNEMASCLLKWVELNSRTHENLRLTIWSDNCAGQIRNIHLVFMYFYILYKFPNIKEINHKYLLKGHTHMEVDSIHSVIERRKKMLKTMDICVPHDWAQFISACGKYKVYEMTLNDFKQPSSLGKISKQGSGDAPFVQRRRNTDADDMLISKCVHLKCTSDNIGTLFYKTSFQCDTFKEIDLRRFTRRPLNIPDELPIANTTLRPLKEDKYKHILELMKWIPDSCRSFYLNLPHGNEVSNNSKVDSDEETQ